MRPGKLAKIKPEFHLRNGFRPYKDECFTVLTNPKIVLSAEGWHEILVVDIMSPRGNIIMNVSTEMLEEIL